VEKILRIGLIGAGRIGTLHGNNLARSVSGAKLEAVAELRMSTECIEWAQGLGVNKISSDPQAIIHDKNVDAVFICSSTDTHIDLIIDTAREGKHIFCEKPIHCDIDAIRRAVSEVEKAGVTFQVGFVRRFDRNHKKVRDIVASGQLGKPHIIKITSRDPEPPPIEYVKVSGGIFMDQMIHDFDMARFLSGGEVTEIAVYGSVRIDERIGQLGDVDTAIAMLKLDNGAIGVIENSRAARYGYDQRTEVHCDKGCVQAGNELNDTAIISTVAGNICERPTWFFLERYNDAFIKEAQAFVQAVNEHAPPLVGAWDGLMPVCIAKAAQLSLREGRSVKLSEIM